MANLVVNGSFEQPIASPQHIYHAQVPGWNTTATEFEIWPNGYNNCFSADQNQNLEILSKGDANGDPMNGATVWQDVVTQAGQCYAFSFFHTPRPGIRSSLTVFINDKHICTIDEDGTSLKSFNWVEFSLNFIAAGNSTRLSFFDARTDAPGAAGTHIDGVVLELVNPTPPNLQTF